jgi:hypothetical protein
MLSQFYVVNISNADGTKSLTTGAATRGYQGHTRSYDFKSTSTATRNCTLYHNISYFLTDENSTSECTVSSARMINE